MANLTVVVDDDLLRRARQRAIEEGISISSVVRSHLRRYARDGSGFEGFLAISAITEVDTVTDTPDDGTPDDGTPAAGPRP